MCLCQASIRCIKCPDHSQMTIQSGYAFLFVCKVQRVTQHSHCESPATAPGARQSEDAQVQGHGTYEAKMDGASRRPGPCVCVQVQDHGTHEAKIDGASRRSGPCVCVQVQGHCFIIAFITCNSNLVPLIEGLCSSNPCRIEFSIFGFFAGIEPTTSGLTVPRSDQLS